MWIKIFAYFIKRMTNGLGSQRNFENLITNRVGSGGNLLNKLAITSSFYFY